MRTVLETPYIVRVLFSLFIILLVNKLTRRLTISVVIGTLVLGLWLGHNASGMITIGFNRVSSFDNIFLMTIIFLIIWLSSQMSATGLMKDLVDFVRSRVPQRMSIALLPAIIGILPMPGGAIFSAPMVEDCDDDNSIRPLLKTKINYWFRHIWEYWWPLYPGVILMLDITKIKVYQLMLLHLPLTLLSIAGGYIFLLRKVGINNGKSTEQKGAGIYLFVKHFYPIIIVVSVYALVEIFFHQIAERSRYLPMIIGIAMAITVVQIRRPLGTSQWKDIVMSRKTLLLVVLVCAIRIYGGFIETEMPGGGFMMTHLKAELSSWNIPVVLLIILLPFISGMTTGIALGFVGASFPVVMSLVGLNSSMADLLSTILLAYVSGYAGMILSPVHVCLVVSNEYFNTRLAHSIISLVRPVALVWIGGFVLYNIIRLL